MSIRHHPSDEILARHAAGRLAAGPALVVATHLAMCPQCRRVTAEFEAVWGTMLLDLPPTPVQPDALSRVLACIDAPAPARTVSAATAPPLLPGGVALPAPLHGCEIGRWLWVAPGIRLSRVRTEADRDAKLLMLRVAPNRRLPEHGHTMTEWTQVISGSFSDVTGRYVAGDFAEADAELEHQPVVDSDRDCICLAAIEGTMRLTGMFGRVLQPFLGL